LTDLHLGAKIIPFWDCLEYEAHLTLSLKRTQWRERTHNNQKKNSSSRIIVLFYPPINKKRKISGSLGIAVVEALYHGKPQRPKVPQDMNAPE
jgi:hypothetical protein